MRREVLGPVKAQFPMSGNARVVRWEWLSGTTLIDAAEGRDEIGSLQRRNQERR